MSGSDDGSRAADVFVAFGVSGDLARKMTFVSLYHLEERGLLSCPIVGVAAEGWTDGDLRQRASESVTAARWMTPSPTRMSWNVYAGG